MSNKVIQLTIYDGLEKLKQHSKTYRKARFMDIYNNNLLVLTKSFVNDEITVDEYKDCLKMLCEKYRKEKSENGYA